MQATRNILLIMGEDHGQWALGAYGNREIHAPTLDHLARTGVQMENAFTPTPVCSPARACLLTGRLASQHGIHDYLSSSAPETHRRRWLADELTLAQLLAEAGYQNGLVGKWHLGNDEEPQVGFEHWYSLTGDYPIFHSGPYRYSDNGRIHTRTAYKTDIITEEAVGFLRDRDAERPFFLFVSYVGTHSPWAGHPERLAGQYRECSFNDIPDDVAYPFGKQNLESTNATRTNPRETLAQYYAAVSHIDEGVGRLIDELETQDLRGSTLVVYVSDHGLNCGQHGVWGKGNGTLPLNMLEESIRVPLLFNHPGALYGRQRRAEFVDHLDLFQTLLEYAQVAPPTDRAYPGCSFFPLLDNSAAPPDWRTVQFGEYGPLRMARTERFKLVRRYPDGPCELFDLRRDPRETVNLFHDPQWLHIVERLTAEIDAYFERYADPSKSGLLAEQLPRCNSTEAWRMGQS